MKKFRIQWRIVTMWAEASAQPRWRQYKSCSSAKEFACSRLPSGARQQVCRRCAVVQLPRRGQQVLHNDSRIFVVFFLLDVLIIPPNKCCYRTDITGTDYILKHDGTWGASTILNYLVMSEKVQQENICLFLWHQDSVENVIRLRKGFSKWTLTVIMNRSELQMETFHWLFCSKAPKLFIFEEIWAGGGNLNHGWTIPWNLIV